MHDNSCLIPYYKPANNRLFLKKTRYKTARAGPSDAKNWAFCHVTIDFVPHYVIQPKTLCSFAKLAYFKPVLRDVWSFVLQKF